MAAGRYTATTNTVIELGYKSYERIGANLVPLEVYEYTKIEIWFGPPNETGSALMQTILPGAITHTAGSNLYTYTVDPLVAAGKYYDVHYYYPKAGMLQTVDAEIFVVNTQAPTVTLPTEDLIVAQENIINIQISPNVGDSLTILIEKQTTQANDVPVYTTVVDNDPMSEFVGQPGKWYYLFSPTLAGIYRISFFNNGVQTSETYSAVARSASVDGFVETRIGFAFNNPDTTSRDGWGAIITPDELRDIYAFGNDLTAANFLQLTDDNLRWWVDNAVGALERELNVCLYKRTFICRDSNRTTTPDGEAGVDYLEIDPYDFRGTEYSKFMFVRLRHRPILEITRDVFKDISGGTIIDLLSSKWLRINHDKGTVQHFPKTGTLAGIPFAGRVFPIDGVFMSNVNYPDAYFIDYTAGFSSARALRAKWPEVFDIVGKLAAVGLLLSYGDGKTAGIASQSLNMAGLSESLSTTMSADNTYFGARIRQYIKDVTEFMKNNKHKYGGLLMAAL